MQKNSKANQQIPTKFTKFPCPKCGKYYEPYMTRKDGKAMCECPNDGLYETNIAVSKNFRVFCSKLGSAPNRDPHYYTSAESIVKRYLENRGLTEGLDFTHNTRIEVKMNGKKRYFWPDFVVPQKKLIIGASPNIWHKMWARNDADDRFTAHMKTLGWDVINLDETNLQQLNKSRTEGKKLGFNPNVKPYHRTENCKKLDSVFGKPQKGGKTKKKEGENT